MSKAQAATINGGRAQSATFASWFAQFDYSRVVVDEAANDSSTDVMQVISNVTSSAARVYINYASRTVFVEIVDRFTNVPKTKREPVHNTVMLELLLRKHKVIIDRQLRKIDAVTDEQLLTVAKGEGFDEMRNRAGEAFERGSETGKLTPADRTAIVLQLQEMGYQSIDITNRYWIEASKESVDDQIVTEASWLNNVRKPRTRKYI